ncbi:hypothetical protein NDU88_002903 [Pleurodeles waltl]|uniref:Uncharacterized protein n=1 Tax=Pleurodeles waltl TaxID=8319 RepID=A0AAV7T4Z3_PLEWA|nr:hypothetical protein NDU88_002903 [Pleurodeles waltl]
MNRLAPQQKKALHHSRSSSKGSLPAFLEPFLWMLFFLLQGGIFEFGEKHISTKLTTTDTGPKSKETPLEDIDILKEEVESILGNEKVKGKRKENLPAKIPSIFGGKIKRNTCTVNAYTSPLSAPIPDQSQMVNTASANDGDFAPCSTIPLEPNIVCSNSFAVVSINQPCTIRMCQGGSTAPKAKPRINDAEAVQPSLIVTTQGLEEVSDLKGKLAALTAFVDKLRKTGRCACLGGVNFTCTVQPFSVENCNLRHDYGTETFFSFSLPPLCFKAQHPHSTCRADVLPHLRRDSWIRSDFC